METNISLPSFTLSGEISFASRLIEFIPTLVGIIAFIFVFLITRYFWIKYVNELYLSKLKWTLLEIRIPKEVSKSPLAMEIILTNALSQAHPSHWYDKLWKGKLAPWFSLEMISIEGDIHFLMRAESRYKNLLETQIYSQYPEAEISEVDDYTDNVSPYMKNGDWNMFGMEFVLSKADPYPIKTYIDYDLAKGGPKKDEIDARIDPMTPLIEYMGSLGKGEQAWVQILVQKAGKRYRKKKDGKLGDWTDEGKDLIKELLAPHKGGVDGPGEAMTKGKMDTINAIERSIGKAGFDCGIRVIYLASTGFFNAENIAGLTSGLKHYSSNDLNGFKGTNVTRFDYPWQDPFGSRVTKRKVSLFEAFKLRSYFYPPYKRKPFVLTSEELATIFHFPGKASTVPSLKRIDSKKSEAPSNLPV